MRNDEIVIKIPIQKDAIKLIIDGLNEMYEGEKAQQPYLNALYQAMIMAAYYGMLRIGEVSKSPHVILAKNVQRVQTKENSCLY